MSKDYAAKILFNGVNRKTKKGKFAIAEWLRYVADRVEDDSHEWSKHFKATYYLPRKQNYEGFKRPRP